MSRLRARAVPSSTVSESSNIQPALIESSDVRLLPHERPDELRCAKATHTRGDSCNFLAHIWEVAHADFLITVATLAQAQSTSPNAVRDATKTPAIPEGKETDIRLYGTNGGGVVIGRQALEQMPKSGLVLWLAGNQFFAMDNVIGAFQKHDPGVSVGLITLPPGLLL